MIHIDSTVVLENTRLTEGYKKYNLQWVKVLIVSIPKTDCTFEEAISKVKRAKTISENSESAIITYYLGGMMTAKEDNEFSHVWMFNPNVVKEENQSQRLAELEQIVDAMLGGDMNA